MALHASLENTCILVAKDSAINLDDCIYMQVMLLGSSLQLPPTCPGEPFTFRCTVTGNKSGVSTWRVNGTIECNLVHRSNSQSSICGPSDDFTARPSTGFGTSATSFTSTLSGTADPALNGTLVECFGPANNVDPGNRINGSPLEILGKFYRVLQHLMHRIGLEIYIVTNLFLSSFISKNSKNICQRALPQQVHKR